jgi:hypothetical protein
LGIAWGGSIRFGSALVGLAMLRWVLVLRLSRLLRIILLPCLLGVRLLFGLGNIVLLSWL